MSPRHKNKLTRVALTNRRLVNRGTTKCVKYKAFQPFKLLKSVGWVTIDLNALVSIRFDANRVFLT